jgi:hypothetical protein
MASYTKFEDFVEAVHEGKHNLASDTLEVALCNAANAPSVSLDSVLADIVQISYTFLSSRVITTASSSQLVAGTYSLVLNDLTLTATGGSAAPFRYVVVFNQTATNDDLICYFDYGSDLTLADGESLTIDFGGDGPTDGTLFSAT